MPIVTLDTDPTSITTLDPWKKAIQTALPGALPAIVHAELQRSMNDFYLRSCAWREIIGPYQVSQGNNIIALNPADAYSRVVHVFDVYLQLAADDRRPLEKLTRPPFADQVPDEPRRVFLIEPYTVQLDPVPNADLGNVLYAYVALTPAEDAAALPDIALTHHFEGILAGAYARLYAQPGKPYSSPDLALFYTRENMRRITAARDMANRGHSNADAPFRFPPFA
jgi:hypothetical protein